MIFTDMTSSDAKLRGNLALRFGAYCLESSMDRSIESMIDWLVGRVAPSVAPSTWRNYRRVIRGWLQEIERDDMIAALSATIARPEKNNDRARKKRNAHGMKFMHQGFINSMKEEAKYDGTLDQAAQILLASMRTGLRPIEWSLAEIKTITTENGSVCALVVQNAKGSHGRTFGDYRLLGLHDEVISVVEKVIRLRDVEIKKRAHYLGGDIDSNALKIEATTIWLGNIRRAIARWNKKKNIPPDKRMTLYSARHQFKNDAKKSGMPPSEIAYIMGHSTIETQFNHYGWRNAAASGLGVGVWRAESMPSVIIESVAKASQSKAKTRAANK